MSNTAKEETEAKARAKEEEGGTADKNVCANCGIAAVDDIKLEECTDCDLVKYCSDKCREDHREDKPLVSVFYSAFFIPAVFIVPATYNF